MHLAWSRLSRAFALLLGVSGLAACVAQSNPYAYNPSPVPGGPAPTNGRGPQPAPGRRISILVPLTGPGSEVGQSMLKAAQLATDAPGAPPLDSRDTTGTPSGAVQAAQAAVAGGAGIILGPLSNTDTGAVAPVARAAHVPVLAFTSDRTQAQPGVWVMGITPAQQVRALVLAVRAEGRTRLGAVLPSNVFGDALADGLAEATAAAGLPPAKIARYQSTGGLSSVEGALAEIAGPLPPVDASAPPAPLPPPAVDALLLGTEGELTAQAIPALKRDGLGPDRVRVLGTALWQRAAVRLSGLAGAWFAAPDPAVHTIFEQQYAKRFGANPAALASIAYDAAGAARRAATPNGFDVNALLRPDGFAGADGVFALQPDGRVLRTLAIFEIGPSGARVRTNGARSLTAPAS